MSTFYPDNEYRDYLSHHGIKGQKWGEQNGPPYPLSGKLHNMVVRGNKKRADKRRIDTLHNPKKLKKRAKEFTKEDIDNALAKMESINKLNQYITKKDTISDKMKQKAKSRKEDAEAEKLRKKIKRYGSTPGKLDKNIEKFTTEELTEALSRLSKKQEIFDKRMNQIDKPRKILDVGADYLKTIFKFVDNGIDLKSKLTPYNPNKLSAKEMHVDWVSKHGYAHVLTNNEVNALINSKKLKGEKIAEAAQTPVSQIPDNLEEVLTKVVSENPEAVRDILKDIFNDK